MDIGCAPVPSCRPEGSASLRRLGARLADGLVKQILEYGAARLKPLVLTLARLLAITSRLVCCASRPVRAIQSERIELFVFLLSVIEKLAGLGRWSAVCSILTCISNWRPG